MYYINIKIVVTKLSAAMPQILKILDNDNRKLIGDNKKKLSIERYKIWLPNISI